MFLDIKNSMCSLWFYVHICNKQDKRRERLKNAAHEKCTYMNEFNTITSKVITTGEESSNGRNLTFV